MKTYEELATAIAVSPELSQMLTDIVAAAREYVAHKKPVWRTEDEQIAADAKAAGKTAWGVPFHPEALILGKDGFTRDEAFRSFIIEELRLEDTEPEGLKTALTAKLNNYRFPELAAG